VIIAIILIKKGRVLTVRETRFTHICETIISAIQFIALLVLKIVFMIPAIFGLIIAIGSLSCMAILALPFVLVLAIAMRAIDMMTKTNNFL
jgi:hypothetical protein